MEIKVENIGFSYQSNIKRKLIFENVSAIFESNKLYAITGYSGSGKTTFLAMLNKLYKPSSGKITFDGEDILDIRASKHRRENVSTIYQSFNLIEYLNAYENIDLALDLAKIKVPNRQDYIYKLLKKVGLNDYEMLLKVNSLSGGEQQRVAIARGIAVKTKFILADEPTGNLDEELSKKIIRLLKKLCIEENIGVIVVTHSSEVCELADVVYEIKNHSLIKING